MHLRSYWFILLASVLLFACKDKGTDTPPVVVDEGVIEGWTCWSPDGRFIYYTRPARDTLEIMKYGFYSIWAYDTQSGNYGFFVGPGEFPKWNPEGTILAFSLGGIIYFYYPETRTVRQVTHSGYGTDIYTFDWSFDGSELLLGAGSVVIDTSGNFVRYLNPINGENRGYGSGGDGDWSFTADRVLLPVCSTISDSSGIIVFDTLGQVIDTVIWDVDYGQSFNYVTWSPDGENITTNYTYIIDSQSYNDLRILNADGSLNTILSNSAGMAAWSPDGTKIAFQKWTWMAESPAPDFEPDIARVTVWVCNADGSDMREILGWPQTGFDSTMFDGGYNWATE